MDSALFERYRCLINHLIKFGKYNELELVFEKLLPNGAVVDIPDYYIGEIYLESTRSLLCPLTLNILARRLNSHSQLRALAYVVNPLSLRSDGSATFTRQKIATISNGMEFQSITEFPMSEVTYLHVNGGKLLIMGKVDAFEKYKHTTCNTLEQELNSEYNYTPNSLIEIDNKSGMTKQIGFGRNVYPVSIASSKHHTIAICTDGNVYGWGSNSNAVMGTSQLPYIDKPTRLRGVTNFSPPMQYDESSHWIVLDYCLSEGEYSHHTKYGREYQYNSKQSYSKVQPISEVKEKEIMHCPIKTWNNWNWGKVSCCDYFSVYTRYDSTLHVWGTNRGQMMGKLPFNTTLDGMELTVNVANTYDIVCCDNAIVLNTNEGIVALTNNTTFKLEDARCKSLCANGEYFALSSGRTVICYSTSTDSRPICIKKLVVPSEIMVDMTLNIRITGHRSIIIMTQEFYSECSFTTKETPLWKPLSGLQVSALDYDDESSSIVATMPMNIRRDNSETHKDPVLAQFDLVPDNVLYTTFLVFARCSSLRSIHLGNENPKEIKLQNGYCLKIKRHDNGGVEITNVDSKILRLFSALLRFNALTISLLIEGFYEQFKFANKFCPGCGEGDDCQCNCVTYNEEILNLSKAQANILRSMLHMIDRDTREGLFETMIDGIGCDIELQPGIWGHKKLLQAHSKLFREVSSGFLVSNEQSISPDTLLNVLEYIYTGDFKRIRLSKLEDRVQLYLEAVIVADMLFLLDDRFMEDMLALLDFSTVIPMMNMLSSLPEKYRSLLLPMLSSIISYHLQYFMGELHLLDEPLYEEFKKISYQPQHITPTSAEEDRIAQQLKMLLGPSNRNSSTVYFDICDNCNSRDTFNSAYAKT